MVTRVRVVPLLLLVSFIEGAAVMVIELSGAKAIAPYYGTSLFAWGAVLGVTIGALALGYFLGGVAARRGALVSTLSRLLVVGAVFAAAAPFLVPWVVPVTDLLDWRAGAVMCVALYLLPPVTCMGAVSPLIVQLINRLPGDAGRSAGTVYAISTVGGILATFLTGFYLLPEIGIRLTALVAAGVLAALGVALRFLPLPDGAGVSAVAEERPVTAATGKPGLLTLRLLLAISFIEGGAVMVMELLGARIAAPYYGASLYVWTAVLAVTLAALALGYFAGGWISRRFPVEISVFAVLLPAGLLTILAPRIAPQILVSTDYLGVRLGAVAACVIYMLPPIACMGMVSPLITGLVDRHRGQAGASAGVVYAVSTVGGILATFLTAFYLLPENGIIATATMTGMLLAGISIGYFYAARRTTLTAGAAVVTAVVALFGPAPIMENERARILYRSSGVLGEWTVIDYGPWRKLAENATVERRLLLNGIDQTYTQIGFEPLSLWHYPHKVAASASMKPRGSRALLLGMGGGSIAYELTGLGFDLDVVELDRRIPDIARQYFRFDPVMARMVIDDARHFIRTTTETYDVVIIDLLIGEVQPTHVFSLEGFADLKKRLRPGALVIVNFQGFIEPGEASRGPRSIYKTLREAGFHVRYSVGSPGPEVTDVVYIASLEEHDYRAMAQDLRYNQWFKYDQIEYEDLVTGGDLEVGDAYVLVDDRPRLELLNAKAILGWRKAKLKEHARRMILEGMPIYR